jgi:hypothetical protein
LFVRSSIGSAATRRCEQPVARFLQAVGDGDLRMKALRRVSISSGVAA